MKNLVSTFFLVVLLISCEKKQIEFSTLSIKLTDNPGPYDSVLVDIVGVEIHTDVNGWQSLPTQIGVYDLLLLQNDVDTILVTPQQIPAGKISQLRLILGRYNRVVVGGISYPLVLSSQDESGLKLNIHRTLMANTPYILLMDFDATESVHITGNDQYKLKPVVRAEFQ